MQFEDMQIVTKLNYSKQNPIKQLEASKSSMKDLLNDILIEKKGFKYQITLKFTLKKRQAKPRN